MVTGTLQRAPADVGDDLGHVRLAVAICQHDDAALAVLAQDLVGTVGFPDSASWRTGTQPRGVSMSMSASACVVASDQADACDDVETTVPSTSRDTTRPFDSRSSAS